MTNYFKCLLDAHNASIIKPKNPFGKHDQQRIMAEQAIEKRRKALLNQMELKMSTVA